MIKELYKIRNIHAFCLVNTITLVRIPLIFMFIYNLIYYLNTKEQSYGLNSIIISMLIIFSDFIDGKLARRYGVTTKAGQVLDIYLDFIYIIVGVLILAVYRQIDYYFIAVIIYKFLEFIIISKLFKGRFCCKKGTDYFFDRLGTIVSGIYYVVPTAVISLTYLDVPFKEVIIRVSLMVITLLTFIASIEKIKNSCLIKEHCYVIEKEAV